MLVLAIEFSKDEACHVDMPPRRWFSHAIVQERVGRERSDARHERGRRTSCCRSLKTEQ